MGHTLDVVIGDVHAHADALHALLREVGVIDSRGRRRTGGRVIQVGDLLDRNASLEANLVTAQLAVDTLDVVLAGNHEWRLMADDEHGRALDVLASRGWPQAATTAGDWLVTHAGVHPALAEDLPADPEACAAEINRRWSRSAKQRDRDPLFAYVGPERGGDDPHGGILWLHCDEWPKHRKAPWGQIAGHVPQDGPQLLPGPRWAIDVKPSGRLAALVRRSGERRWHPVVVKPKARDRRALPVAA